MSKISTAVQLGRVAPYHIFHQQISRVMLELVAKGDFQQALMLIGSSNQYNEDTPYTFGERKQMVQTIYPELEVLPLADAKQKRQYKDDFEPTKWLDSISALEESRDAKFIFLVGHIDDAKWVKQRFEYRLIIDRAKNQLSASKVRNAIRRFILGEQTAKQEIEQYLDHRIVDLVIEGYRRWLASQLLSPNGSY